MSEEEAVKAIAGVYFRPGMKLRDALLSMGIPENEIDQAIASVISPAVEKPPSVTDEQIEEIKELVPVDVLELVDIAEEEGLVSVSVVPALPWYAGWIAPVMDWISNIGEWSMNAFAVLLKPFKPIGDFFADPLGYFRENLGGLLRLGSRKGLKGAAESLDSILKGSIEEEVEFKTALAKLEGLVSGGYTEAAKIAVTGTVPGSLDAAVAELGKTANELQSMYGGLYTAHSVVEAASLGQFEYIRDMDSLLLSKFGFAEIMRASYMLPIEKRVIIRAEQFYNKVYTPEIPQYADLINMVVKEKITLDEFKDYLSMQGFSNEFAQLIWDAHFIAPSLGQLLTAWRRDVINTEELDKLEILVDLDPLYKPIWNEQRYDDPTLREGRYMFEQGAITTKEVEEVVKRSGLVPKYIDPMTKYLTTFQERPWRGNYLGAVARAFREGVYTEARLRTEVIAAGYTKEVADWIVKREDVEKEIAEAEVKPEKFRLLTVADVKDLYLNDDVDDEWLMDYYEEKGYDTEDRELALKVMKRKKGAA